MKKKTKKIIITSIAIPLLIGIVLLILDKTIGIKVPIKNDNSKNVSDNDNSTVIVGENIYINDGAALISSSPSTASTLTESNIITPTLSIEPEISHPTSGYDGLIYYNQLYRTWLEVHTETGYNQYGYFEDRNIKNIISGLDNNDNVIWSQYATYVGDGLYEYSLESECEQLEVRFVSTLPEYNHRYNFPTSYIFDNNPNTCYTTPIGFIKIEFKDDSIYQCRRLDSIEHMNKVGYEPYYIKDKAYLEEYFGELYSYFLLEPGEYLVTYIDGTTKKMAFYGDDIYDFSR